MRMVSGITRPRSHSRASFPTWSGRYKETDSAWVREELSRYQNSATCETCHGARLKPEALAVKINGRHISDVTELSIADAGRWFGALNDLLTSKQQEISYRILKEINERLGFLNNVGLEYLTLARGSATLSGGESQRIRPRLADRLGPDRRALCPSTSRRSGCISATTTGC